MGEDEFRLPGSSYDELVKIIRAYGHIAADASLTQVSQLAAIHQTVVSRNNAFLVGVGVVAGGQQKAITPEGKLLARALDHNIPEEISKHWRQLVERNQFFQRILAAISIRRGMDESTLQAHIAYSAGQKRSQAVMAGSAAVVEVMRVAGLIRDEQGKFVVSDASPQSTQAVEESSATTETRSNHAELVDLAPGAKSRGVNVTIQVSIQCTPDQLDLVATKIRDLISKVNETKTEEPAL